MPARVLMPGKEALASVLGKLKDIDTLSMGGGKCACVACNSCTCACSCTSACRASCSCGKCRHHPHVTAVELAWD